MRIGIIGGTGLDDPDIIANRTEVEFTYNLPWLTGSGVAPDYGKAVDKLITGTINGVECAILPRHGRNHSVSPTSVNYRANILSLYQWGCDLVIATHSIGSLKEEYRPGDFVILEQIIDRTQKRSLTYFDNEPTSWKGVVHATFGDPYHPGLLAILREVSRDMDFTVHPTGTCVAIEGPRFSTRAESVMFRGWGADTIGMTQIPEAQLATELHLPFCAVGMVTDYDAWREHESVVTVEHVVKLVSENKKKMIRFLMSFIDNVKKNFQVKEDIRNVKPGLGFYAL